MHRHWAEFGPPTYVTAAVYSGILKNKKPPADFDAPPRDEEDPDGLGELIAMFGGGGGVIG